MEETHNPQFDDCFPELKQPPRSNRLILRLAFYICVGMLLLLGIIETVYIGGMLLVEVVKSL